MCYGRRVSGDDVQNPSLQDRTQAFLREFFTKGEELVRELIDENERLRATSPDPGTPVATVKLVERLKEQIEELESECAEIRRLAGLVKQGSGGYRTRLDSLEQEHYQLAAMYVAGGQFNRATTVDEVVRTITEVLLNFVGVGTFTIFGIDEPGKTLFGMFREGKTLQPSEEFALPGSGPMATAVGLGQAWKPGGPLESGGGGMMHLPLFSGTRLVGVVRIEQFLPQKTAFAENDFGLLELISEQSGIAIENAWVRAHAAATPFSRTKLEELLAS